MKKGYNFGGLTYFFNFCSFACFYPPNSISPHLYVNCMTMLHILGRKYQYTIQFIYFVYIHCIGVVVVVVVVLVVVVVVVVVVVIVVVV